MMGSMKERLKIRGRRYTQLIAAVLFNFHLTGFFSGTISKSPLKGICAPGLNCYSCPGATLSCPLGSLQGALSKASYKLPLYMLGTILLMGIFFGRLICGFLCPFGLLQELLYKLPIKKLKKNRFTRALSYLKYVILAVFVVVIPIVKMEPSFCKYICPAGTLEAGLPLTLLNENLRALLGGLFSWKVFVLVLVIFLTMILYRAFCRFLCPLGAILSFFNSVSFFGIKREEKSCTHCDACVKMCKMDVRKPGDHECISCGECQRVCAAGAIRFKTMPLNPKERVH